MDNNPVLLQRRLELIIDHLENLPDRYEAMKRHFNGWRDQRLLTIAAIEEVKGKLDYVFQKASTAAAVGGGVSLLGSVCSIVGVVVGWMKGSSSSAWTSAGSKMTVVGNVIIPAATFAEYGFSTRYLRQVQEFVDRDQEASRPLFEFLEDSRTLDTAVLEVFGCSVFSDSWQDVVACLKEVMDNTKNVGGDIVNIGGMIRRRVGGGKIPEDIMEEIGDAWCRNWNRAGNTARDGCLRMVQRIQDVSRVPAVAIAVSSWRLYENGNTLLSGEVAPARVAQVRWGEIDMWSKLGHGLLEFANILLDIAVVMKSLNDMQGESNYSRRLEEIKQVLTRELTTVQNDILLNRYN